MIFRPWRAIEKREVQIDGPSYGPIVVASQVSLRTSISVRQRAHFYFACLVILRVDDREDF